MTDSKDSRGCGFALFTLILAAPLCLCGAFADGYVLSRLWAWFAVPQGVRSLSWQTFAAASMAYSIFTLKIARAEPKDTRSETEKVSAFVLYLAAPWLMLLVGWWIK